MTPKLAILDKKKFGPWAIVTGASSGIGREFARQIASNGISVVLVARRLKLLEEAGQSIKKEFGVDYRVVQADLSENGFLEVLTKAANDLDIGLVISNAGTANPGEFLKHDLREMLKLFRLNAQAHLEISYDFGKKLVKRGQGGIVLIGAMGAVQGVPYAANESASKSYVETLGKCLNFELSPMGINVTVLVVGPTQTAIIDKFGLDLATMPMKPMSVEQCVFEGLEALKKNRATIINGRTNRIMNALMPPQLSRKMMKKMMEEGLEVRMKREES
jgi:uncharacterized protein